MVYVNQLYRHTHRSFCINVTRQRRSPRYQPSDDVLHFFETLTYLLPSQLVHRPSFLPIGCKHIRGAQQACWHLRFLFMYHSSLAILMTLVHAMAFLATTTFASSTHFRQHRMAKFHTFWTHGSHSNIIYLIFL